MKKIFLLCLFFTAILTACQTETILPSVDIAPDYKQVEISLKTTTGNTILSEVSDDMVSELDLLVFKNGKYQYTKPAYPSQYATFRSTLKIDQGVDIYFLANCNYLVQEDILVEGRSWDDIRKDLILNNAFTVVNGKSVLPMWGRAKGVNIADDKINEVKVSLLRAAASANVIFDLDTVKSLEFRPHVAHIYYGADIAFVAPEESNLTLSQGQITGVVEPVSPQGMKTNRILTADAVNGAFVNSLYMLENSYDGGNNASADNRRTRLVIGGYIGDSDELRYFPLDFSYSKTNEILKVTRNSRYNLTITSVNSEGWPDPDEAAENARVDLDYDIIEWNDHDHDNMGIDGPDYLSVSSKSVKVFRKAGAHSYIKLNGTYSKEDISFAFVENSLNGVGQPIQNGMENERFRVELEGSGTVLNLKITALKDYSEATPQLNKDAFVLSAGRLRFDIEIEQVNSGEWDNGGDNQIDL